MVIDAKKNKMKWEKPELTQLNIQKTKGGPTFQNQENKNHTNIITPIS